MRAATAATAAYATVSARVATLEARCRAAIEIENESLAPFHASGGGAGGCGGPRAVLSRAARAGGEEEEGF